jgi:DNA-binding PadR family transcriptional regulator
MDHKRDILYSFWESLPPLKVIIQTEEEIYAHKARRHIIQILRRGLLEQEDNVTRRRALNAREILKLLQQKQLDTLEDASNQEKGQDASKTISLQSLYFHLQKLEEAGLLQTVTILREGRHNTAYYGRTARIYLHTDPKKNESKITEAFQAISEFASIISPKFEKAKMEELLEKFLLFEDQRRERISTWLTQYESMIIEYDIDLTGLFKFMELIDTINPDIIKLFQEIIELLSFESVP